MWQCFSDCFRNDSRVTSPLLSIQSFSIERVLSKFSIGFSWVLKMASRLYTAAEVRQLLGDSDDENGDVTDSDIDVEVIIL